MITTVRIDTSRPFNMSVILVLLTLFFLGGLSPSLLYARSPLPQQTDVDRAIHLIGEDGIPQLRIEGIGTHHNPAWVALYALAYAGIEIYDDTAGVHPDSTRFEACVDWLADNLIENMHGERVWIYDFDNTYNDVVIEAPWSSAFAQATGIQALLASYRLTGNHSHLVLAEEAALPLFRLVQDGGLLFSRSADIWFEEIPLPADNPSHILNGHMRTLLALQELAEITEKDEYRTWFERGIKTLLRWLPLYDTSYWLRYDLNPRKSDLLFRIANPYGFSNPPIAIDRITLRDPISKKEISIDVGVEDDAQGDERIGGIHWGLPGKLDGRSIRRLVPAENGFYPNKPVGGMIAPHSYFYLSLPGEWNDHLRHNWYELEIEYLDDVRSNLTVQMRSIAPGSTFRDMRDGDLMLAASGHWRKWIVPVRISDLGYWVGASYAEKHASYLRQLAGHVPELERWAQLAEGYQRLGLPVSDKKQIAGGSVADLPEQTPMLPIYPLDNNGVRMQSRASSSSKFLADGKFDSASDPGKPVYSPYVIADQLLNGPMVKSGGSPDIDRHSIRREPALHWFLDSTNQRQVGDAIVYDFQFDNIYNDVVTTAPWGSAFSQAYILKAFRYAREHMSAEPSLDLLLPGVVRAFERNITDGGLSTLNRASKIFFEEVPNGTHVLNAHLVSVDELLETAREVPGADAKRLGLAGFSTLHDLLWRFDTGYWLKYDQNPKKDILIQFDWIGGNSSPAIDEILLENPLTNTAIHLDIGGVTDALNIEGHIAGIDWLERQIIDGRTVRTFRNGYVHHKQPLKGGTQHNVYLATILSEQDLTDSFDFLPYRLLIRYKDVSKGQFGIKIQSINQGNHLTFVPLRRGVLQTEGDGKWKEAAFILRQQDLGWYKGSEYQRYEVNQLQRIANRSNDWFFYQYAERHWDFLALQQDGQSVMNSGAWLTTRETMIPSNDISVLHASATYPGHGFGNALDGVTDDDYVAGLEGEKKAWVNLRWPYQENVRGLRILWENRTNFAGRIRVYRLKSNGDTDDIIGTFISTDGLVKTLIFDNPQSLDGLRLEFDRFFGQSRLLMRQLTVLTYDANVLQPNLSAQEARGDFLGAHDENNPLHIFRYPVTDNIKKLSDRLIIGAESEDKMVIRFMDYIAQFRVGFASKGTPEKTVAERVGACGSFSGTLLALSAAQGLQGRYINLYNYPKNNGHTVVEIFIKGAWRLYDPTYGAYYVSTEKGSSYQPLSYKAIREGYRDGNSIQPVISAPRLGREDFTGRDIFVKAEPAGIIGPDKPLIFSLKLINGVNESLTDSNMGLNSQGADYIGAASVNQQQQWLLYNLIPGERYTFSIMPKFLGGDLQGSELKFTLSAKITGGTPEVRLQNVFDFQTGKAEPWNIQFIADEATVTIRLSHPYLGPEYRYMYIKRYDLKKTL